MAQLESLPMELLSHILSFCTLSDQLKLASVCRRWRQAVDICLSRLNYFSSKLIRGWPDMTDQMLERILPRLGDLHHLVHVYGYDLDLDIISRHCPQLRELDLSSFQADVSSLERLGRSCPNLTAIHIPRGGHDSCIEAICRGLPGLRLLDVDVSDVTGRCLARLPVGLQRLTLSGSAKYLVPAKLSQPVQCPALTELDLARLSSPSPDVLARLLVVCPRLERLNCKGSFIGDGFLDQLPEKTPGIRHLNLANCPLIPESGLMHLGRLKQLRSLNLSVTNTTDRVLEQLCGAFNLTELVIGPVRDVRQWGRKDFSGGMLARLAVSSPSLRRLVVHGGFDITELVRRLADQLSADRDLTIFAASEAELGCVKTECGLSEDGPLRLAAVSDWEDDWEDHWDREYDWEDSEDDSEEDSEEGEWSDDMDDDREDD